MRGSLGFPRALRLSYTSPQKQNPHPYRYHPRPPSLLAVIPTGAVAPFAAAEWMDLGNHLEFFFQLSRAPIPSLLIAAICYLLAEFQ